MKVQNSVKRIAETMFLLKELLNKVNLKFLFPDFRNSTDKRQRSGLTRGRKWSLCENS